MDSNCLDMTYVLNNSCKGSLVRDFSKKKLLNYISRSQEVSEMYNTSLLLGTGEYSQEFEIQDTKFTLGIIYHHHATAPSCSIKYLCIDISVLDTEKEVIFYASLPNLMIVGNTREYKFRHTAIGNVKLSALTDLYVEEDAFDSVRFINSNLVLSDTKVGEETVPFCTYAMRNCVVKHMHYMSVKIAKAFREKNNRALYANKAYQGRMCIYSDTTQKSVRASIEELDAELREIYTVVRGLYAVHLTVHYDNYAEDRDKTILLLDYAATKINEYAYSNRIMIKVTFLGVHLTRDNLNKLILEVLKDKDTIYTSFESC